MIEIGWKNIWNINNNIWKWIIDEYMDGWGKKKKRIIGKGVKEFSDG